LWRPVGRKLCRQLELDAKIADQLPARGGEIGRVVRSDDRPRPGYAATEKRQAAQIAGVDASVPVKVLADGTLFSRQCGSDLGENPGIAWPSGDGAEKRLTAAAGADGMMS
jgi:hypothetical protein